MLGTGFLIRGYVAGRFIEANVFSGSLPVLDTVSHKVVQAIGAGGLAPGIYTGVNDQCEKATLALNSKSKRLSRFERQWHETATLA